jgi:hypothetical protein
MKATEFEVVKEARRAAQGHLVFFNRMMAVKVASSSGCRSADVIQVNKKKSSVMQKTAK